MGENLKNRLLLKKLKKNKDHTDNESDTVNVDQCDNEIKLEDEVNIIESSSREDEYIFYIYILYIFYIYEDEYIYCYIYSSKKESVSSLILKLKMI